MGNNKILIVDDDPQILKAFSRILCRLKFNVITAGSGEEALEILLKDNFHLMLIDINLPSMSGFDLLKEVKRNHPEMPVLVITPYGSTENAIQAMKMGADGFLEKPIDIDHLISSVQSIFEKSSGLKREGERSITATEYELIGNSRQIRDVRHLIERISRLNAPVMITGENGTEKEIAARMIHQLSGRSEKPFIEVNCSEISASAQEGLLFGYVKGAFQDAFEERQGYFEEADEGTIYLDEIECLDLKVQEKVLRVIQDGTLTRISATNPIPVDARVIASTSKDLKQMVLEKKFLKDLYHRLCGFTINIPPLRERKEDLLILINHILGKLPLASGNKPVSLSLEFLEILKHYDFPENLCELKNIIEHSVLLANGNVLTPDTLPSYVMESAEISMLIEKSDEQTLTLKQAKAKITAKLESKIIKRMLKECNGNYSLTAKKLGISRSALYYKIKQYKIFNSSS